MPFLVRCALFAVTLVITWNAASIHAKRTAALEWTQESVAREGKGNSQ